MAQRESLIDNQVTLWCHCVFSLLSGEVFSFYPLSCHNAGECINSTFTNLATLHVTSTQEVTDALRAAEGR